jgi:glycine/D-amino acid oxidase-like deaminating enzyme
MYLPPPGKIAIIGAGPIGLEAALYARYLGYAVEVFERDQVAQSIRTRGSEQLAKPFAFHASPLGLAALAAQDAAFRPPQAGELLTGNEWIDRYLAPLAKSDLIIDGLHERTTVVGIEQLQGKIPPRDEDDELPPPAFRLQLIGPTGETITTEANVIIDASGSGERCGFENSLPLRISDTAEGTSSVFTRLPSYYLLGGKSRESLTFAEGLDQIRDLFTRIGDRAELNLYETMA